MIVMDSGLGGLSVVRAMRAQLPESAVSYLADTAGFPYGARGPSWIEQRANQLVRAITAREQAEIIVLACNTLSTLALASLRQSFTLNFVGTVPAIKVAAETSRTRRFTLLATPNTAHGKYVSDLIAQFASDCIVDSFGAPRLASYAERILCGETVEDAALAEQIAPCFHDDAKGKTDAVILGCTHYPLITDRLKKIAPWPVTWIDSSAAIARRALSHGSPTGSGVAYVTRAEDVARYAPLFAAEGFARTDYVVV